MPRTVKTAQSRQHRAYCSARGTAAPANYLTPARRDASRVVSNVFVRRRYEIGLDPITVLGIVLLTMVVGILLDLAPVLRLRRMNLNVELREETRGGASATLVRNGLPMAPIALALILLVGAGPARELPRRDDARLWPHARTSTTT